MSDFRQPPNTKVAYHIVAPGETLYSIAWRYNIDYKKLAKANDIGRNYLIHPGQKIYLDGRATSSGAPVSRTAKALDKTASTAKTHTEVVRNQPSESLKKETELTKKQPAYSVSRQAIVWRWPSKGSILKRYEQNTGPSKGIDLGGSLGEPVMAAAAGTVVYAGDGLRGYGKLIIIKHSDKFLSAYAHNKKILVGEGDAVKLEEIIAEMGSSGTDSVKLHFEIRYDGQPVNPLDYLPKR